MFVYLCQAFFKFCCPYLSVSDGQISVGVRWTKQAVSEMAILRHFEKIKVVKRYAKYVFCATFIFNFSMK